MILPILSTSGTPKETLLANLQNASMSLSATRSMIKLTAPQGKDYGPKTDKITGWRFKRAAEEHDAMLRNIDAVRNEIDQMITAISEMERP